MTRNGTRKCRQGGFTLTEMLIVLGILVMLLALVVPRFLGSQKKADIQAATAQIGLLRGALENYWVDMKDFPTTEQGLDALLNAPSDEDAQGGTTGATGTWNGPYLNKEIPLDPWGNAYQYAYPPERGSGDFPDIWSYGPDREDDTDDDICSWGSSGGSGGSGEEGVSGKRRKDTDVDVDVKVGGKGARRERSTEPKAPREPRAPRERQP